MLEQSILDKIVDFFKSLGTKKASGEPIDLGRPKHDWESEEKQVQIRHDAPVNIEGEPGSKKDTVIELTKEETQPAQEPEAEKSQPAKTVVAKVRPKRTYCPEVEVLRAQYVWRKLKAEKALTVQPLPEPFFFLTADNQPVEASKLEVSFVKELLTKAAEAGIENKFTFSLSSTMSVVVKYKKKMVGRVYLHGKKHRMTFKINGKTVREDNMSLAETKKLIPIWIGQIKDSLTA